MPKIIEGAREKIMETAKKRLFEKGYQHMSLREVAKESGIATGTIYNYFMNKDYMIANIMLEDWHVALAKMDESVQNADSVSEGIEGICQALYEFRDIYKEIWTQPAVAAAASMDVAKMHQILSSQMEERLFRLLNKTGYEDRARFTLSMAELILASLYQKRLRTELKEIADIMYPKKN